MSTLYALFLAIIAVIAADDLAAARRKGSNAKKGQPKHQN